LLSHRNKFLCIGKFLPLFCMDLPHKTRELFLKQFGMVKKVCGKFDN
jgi:hypothetical protein